jgi:hypothetical protein
MDIRPEHIAPCGLYCGVCRIHYATQENDQAGCLSTRRSVFCRECAIRECTQQKGFQGCHECPEFPCSLIDEFPLPVGKKVILRAIPYWRTYGTEQ